VIEKTGILAPNEAKAAFHRIAGRDARYKNSIPMSMASTPESFAIWRDHWRSVSGTATPSRVYA